LNPKSISASMVSPSTTFTTLFTRYSYMYILSQGIENASLKNANFWPLAPL